MPAPDEKLVLELLDLVGKSAQEVLSIKSKVLDTTRTLEPAPVEIGALVNDVVSRSYSDKVKVVVAGDMEMKVLADKHALVRLFDNALGNAVRVLGGVKDAEIKVSWRRDGTEVEIEVRDNGPGFPDDIVNSGVIPRFGAEKDGGSGVGLWLSERLAFRMGGKLYLGNLPGHGAYVRVRLPAVG
jgi:signal transduction histidine kinase